LRLLLYTNALVRWMAGSPLPKPVERVLARQDTECLVSVITCWEIVLKPKLRRSAADVETAIHAMGAILLPIRFNHLEELSHLPAYEDHRDPFDRMLIAQALAEAVPIVSSDMRFAAYKRLRVFWDQRPD
jgi:PIN domain nuclease of toxin-antitoxin system